MKTEPTEKQLIASRKVIDEFVREHKSYLKYFILKRAYFDKECAEDIYQRTLLEAIRSYHKFRGESSVKSWICGIAHYLIINHRHRDKKLNYSHDDISEMINEPTDDKTSDEVFEEKQKRAFLEECLKMISPKLSRVVSLNNRGCSYEEISKIENITIGTVRSRISRGKAHLIRTAQSREKYASFLRQDNPARDLPVKSEPVKKREPKIAKGKKTKKPAKIQKVKVKKMKKVKVKKLSTLEYRAMVNARFRAIRRKNWLARQQNTEARNLS